MATELPGAERIGCRLEPAEVDGEGTRRLVRVGLVGEQLVAVGEVGALQVNIQPVGERVAEFRESAVQTVAPG